MEAGVQELVPGFVPEDETERKLADDPTLREGWAWGKPRKGHPEGSVGSHVGHLLERLDEWGETGQRRRDLRFLALVHDALKHEVSDWRPRTGENHHAMRARRHAERYTDDERLLSTLELHDRPYSLWRRMRRKGKLDEKGFARMLERLADPGLFLRFVELDGSTEGKNPEPVRWLEEELRRRGAL
jgi:hypothetical protein